MAKYLIGMTKHDMNHAMALVDSSEGYVLEADYSAKARYAAVWNEYRLLADDDTVKSASVERYKCPYNDWYGVAYEDGDGEWFVNITVDEVEEDKEV